MGNDNNGKAALMPDILLQTLKTASNKLLYPHV